MGGKYSVLIEGETLAQLKSAVAEIHNELQAIGGQTTEAPKGAVRVTEEPHKKAAAKKAKEEPPVEKEAEPEADIFGAEESAAPENEKEQEPPAPPPPPAKAYTKSQVKEVLQKVITKLGDKGIKEGVKILGTFGVKSLTALPEDKYAAFVAACEKVL